LQILAAQDHKTYGRYLKRNSLNWLELVQAALKPSHRGGSNRAGLAGHIDLSILSPQSEARAKLTSAPHHPVIIPSSGPIGTMAQRV
jgi:hypothetical protein